MHPYTLFLPHLFLLITSASEASWQGADSSEDSSEGSGGHWEDDEDVVPLSAEQRLRDAARFRDELLWDAEREVERARLAPTPPLQPRHDDFNSNSGSDLISRSEVLREALKSTEALSGGHSGGARDDLYFQDGAPIHDDKPNGVGENNDSLSHRSDSDSTITTKNSELPINSKDVNAEAGVSVANGSTALEADDSRQSEAIVPQSRGSDVDVGRQKTSDTTTPVLVQGVLVASGVTPSTGGNSSDQQPASTEEPTQPGSIGKAGANGENEDNDADAGDSEKADKTVVIKDPAGGRRRGNGIQPERKANVSPIEAMENTDPIKETNGISRGDAMNAVNANKGTNTANGVSETTGGSSSKEEREPTEKIKSGESSRQDSIADLESTDQEQLQMLHEGESDSATQSQVTMTQKTAFGDGGSVVQGTEDPLAIALNPSTAPSQPEKSSATSRPISHGDRATQSGESTNNTKLNADIAAADSYLQSDACRTPTTNSKSQDTSGGAEDDRTPDRGSRNDTAVDAGQTDIDSDACREDAANVKSQDHSSQREPTSRGPINGTQPREQDSYLNSDACRNAAADGRSKGTANEKENEKPSSGDLTNETRPEQAIEPGSYLNSDACKNVATDKSLPDKLEDATESKGDNESDSLTVELVTPQSSRARNTDQKQHRRSDTDGATVTPLAAPPTPRVSVNNRTSSSTTAPSHTESSGATSPPASSDLPLDLSEPSDPPSDPIESHDELSDISDPEDPSPTLNIPPNSSSSLSESQTSSSNLSEPVAAAALFHHNPFNCQWRCRSLLSDLRLQVEPPRLLVASGASVSVLCRLPARRGALTQLTWSFRPAGRGKCALTPTERDRGKKAMPRCDGFGDAAQMYFVNQTMTSSRLAIPHVTPALAGHYTCTARVRCCAGTTASTPATSRALSTYIHVYGRQRGTSHWAVSVAVGVCLAVGLTAVVALRRRCCRRGKRAPGVGRMYPGVRRMYRPVPDGQQTEEDQEWVRLYTGPLVGGEENGTGPAPAPATTATPHRQQFRQCHEATQETALSASSVNAPATSTTTSSASNASIAAADDDDQLHADCDEAVAARSRTAGLGAAFSHLPETHIARTHAARPAHIRANPLASPQFRYSPPVGGTAVVSPRYEIPLTPPDAPPTPPDAPPKGTTMPPKGTTTTPKGSKMASRQTQLQPRQPTAQAAGPLWRLGAAARQ